MRKTTLHKETPSRSIRLIARFGLATFGVVVTTIAGSALWVNNSVYAPLVTVVDRIPSPYNTFALVAFGLVLFFAIEALIALGGLAFATTIFPLFLRNTANTRVVRVHVSKRQVMLSITDCSELIAMCVESGARTATRALIGEAVKGLDYAVDLPGDRPIRLTTDAITERTARRIGLRLDPSNKIGWLRRAGFAITMGPLLKLLRAFTKGRGYTLCAWTLDRKAYAAFRSEAKTAKIVGVTA